MTVRAARQAKSSIHQILQGSSRATCLCARSPVSRVGAFDPIDEALKRGQIVAIGFLGNLRTQYDRRLQHAVKEFFLPGSRKKDDSLGRIYQAEGQAHDIYKRKGVPGR